MSARAENSPVFQARVRNRVQGFGAACRVRFVTPAEAGVQEIQVLAGFPPTLIPRPSPASGRRGSIASPLY